MNTSISKVHCFFEQSGTFKNEFIKLGIPAEDYDIQNNFGQTDHVMDLFGEIEKAYEGGGSIFDTITKDALIMAFFPCIYFEAMQMSYFSLDCNNLRSYTTEQKYEYVLERAEKRHKFYILLWKLFAVVERLGLRMIVENPATLPHYLLMTQNFKKPTMIDSNRQRRGDFFKKPTAYWFINIERTYGQSYQQPREKKIVVNCKRSGTAGICNEERSLISTDYARNFIHDFILGKPQEELTIPSIFQDELNNINPQQ